MAANSIRLLHLIRFAHGFTLFFDKFIAGQAYVDT